MHPAAGPTDGTPAPGQTAPGSGAWRDGVAVEVATDAIAALRDYADRLGVRLEARDGPTGIDLEWLCRRPRAPRGAGAAVLRALCGHADRAGRPVRLIVLAGRDRLLAYYARFGFEVACPGEEETDSTELVRAPDGAPQGRAAGQSGGLAPP